MSTRQLRSRIVDSKTGNKRKLAYDGLNGPVIEPRQRQKNTYYCLSCGDDKPSRMFPNYNPSPGCDHSMYAYKNASRSG